MDVSVREFKMKLSDYLRQARAGRDVVITSRGRPIARILAITGDAAKERTPRNYCAASSCFPAFGWELAANRWAPRDPFEYGPDRKLSLR